MNIENGNNNSLIDHTIKMWNPRFDKPLSREDARQIAENITGFFAVLNEWARAETPGAVNDEGKFRVSVNEGKPHDS